MGELIPPGSLVEVDTQQNVAHTFAWRAIRDVQLSRVALELVTLFVGATGTRELVMFCAPVVQSPVRHVKTPAMHDRGSGRRGLAVLRKTRTKRRDFVPP